MNVEAVWTFGGEVRPEHVSQCWYVVKTVCSTVRGVAAWRAETAGLVQ